MGRFLLSLAVTLAATGMLVAGGMSYGKAPMPGEKGPDAPELVGVEQKLGAQVPLDLEFRDHLNQPTTLRSVMSGKPTILVPAYYRCPKLCNMVLTGLLDALNEIRRKDPDFVAGGPFNVVVVSIDPREAPQLALPKRELFLREYDKRSPDQPGVWLLTSSQGQGTDLKEADRKVHQLTDTIGFNYSLRFRRKDYFYRSDTGIWVTKDEVQLHEQPREYDYAHDSAIMFVSPEGKVTRYLPGIKYDATVVRTSIVEASQGKVGTVADWVRLNCFVYDEVHKRYKPTMQAMGILFTPFFLLVLFIAYRSVRQGMREKPLVKETTSTVTPNPAPSVN